MKRNKMFSFISLVMFFSILLNITLPIISQASNPIDYKKLVEDIKVEKNIEFDTPISLIEITHNGSTYTSIRTQDTVETINALNFIKVEKGKEFKVGDTITVNSISIPGSGGSITAYDWQIGKDYTWSGPSAYDYKSSKSFTYTLDRPGTWVIFLNGRDSYKISGTNFENWSDWGIWRTEEPPPFQYTGADIKGWYFAALKLEVIDTAKPKAEFEIHYQGQNKTDNYSSPVELEKYPATVNLIDKSTTERGDITSWEWQRKLPNGSWQFLSNAKNPSATINQSLETFRERVVNSEGKESDWVEHVILSKLKGNTEPPDPIGTIKIILDGPEMAEWGDTIYLDSSRSVSTSTIVKREYWRRTSAQKDWVKQSEWDNVVKPKEKTIDRGTASYIEYMIEGTDLEGRKAKDTHRVMMVEAVEPEIHANLRFITGDRKAEISLEDYLANKEMTISYWVDASATSWLGTSLGLFYFFQNTDDSTIRKYEDDERNARNDINFIQGEYEDNPVRISTRDDPESIRDAAAWGTFKFTPQNPQIKAAVMVRSSNVSGPYSFATAYHTVEFDVDSIPPETQLTIPSPFYPKEIDNAGQKTITWTYYSEQDIPYNYSVVSLYRKNGDGHYETVFKDKIITERYLMVDGNAHEEYEIEVKVVDQLNKESDKVDGEFTIIGAVPIIDLELDNKTDPDILKIQVFNKTPEEIESLFPTSYTSWKIEDADKNIIVEGDEEAPKAVDLDYRFNRGKYTVTQYATNTLGVTAYASKDFEITSILDFKAEPYVQFEDDFIELIDLSKYITDRRWEIRENNEIEFSNLYLNENNEFSRNEGIYQVKLRGIGYFEYIGEAEREVTKSVAFLSTKPSAAFILGGNLKMYKEIILDGSISKQVTEERLQAKYPIDFTHEKTVFEIIPIKDKDGETDTSRLEYILGHDKEVLEDRVIFKGKQLISIRIDKEGWYKARYKVYNHRKESDWYEEEFYVSPKLSPRADISVGAPVVFRAPDNELKVKMEVIVDYESLDEEIDFDESTLFLSYSPHREGTLEQISDMYIMKNSRILGELTTNFSDIVIDWREKRAVFTLILDDPEKNFFGRFIFDFLAIEKEKIPNYTEVGYIPDDLSRADTSHVNAELKTILIDNNKPYIELETTKTNTVDIYILEEREKEKELDVNSIIEMLNLNRIKTRVIIIRPDGVEIIE